jgi:hypothetical protein
VTIRAQRAWRSTVSTSCVPYWRSRSSTVVLSTSLAHRSASSAVIAYSFEPTKIVTMIPVQVGGVRPSDSQ